MLEKFDGNIIDTNSVILIINKLKMYEEEEEKIVTDIENSLNNLENYYSSDNDKILTDKKNKLYEALNITIENRKRYITFLTNIVANYIDSDARSALKFENYDIN